MIAAPALLFGRFEIRTFDLSVMIAYDMGAGRKSEMAGLIEELFYGNIDPQARSAAHNTAVQKEMQTLSAERLPLTASRHIPKSVFCNIVCVFTQMSSK